MTALTYFESITSQSALRRHQGKQAPLHTWQRHELPAASGWDTRELFATRVVVRHVHGGVLRYRDPSSSAFLDPPPRKHNSELSKVINPLQPDYEGLTETELIRRLGGTAGIFWAALRRFTREQPPGELDDAGQPVTAVGQYPTRSYAHVTNPSPAGSITTSDSSDLEMPDIAAPAIPGPTDDNPLPAMVSSRPQRVRRQPQQHPGYVDSSKIEITSSSPAAEPCASSSFASDNAGHVSVEEHTAKAMSEDATVHLASAFLRHSLVYCPLQLPAAGESPPKLLLEFSNIRRRMFTRFGHDALELEATADGEIALLYKSRGRYVDDGQVRPALLEAKKRFKLIRNGKPVITDDVLGQTVGEALALRLSLADLHNESDRTPSTRTETVIVIIATRQYMCFLSFHIPDSYVETLRFPSSDNHSDDEPGQNGSDKEGIEGGEDDEAWDDEGQTAGITVHTTDWLDLSTKRCRQLVCDNVAALVAWQQRF